MILIADSGSTKVSWRVIHKDGTIQAIQTIGINPFFVPEEDILKTMEEGLKPAVKGNVERVFFYGAGVAGKDKVEILTRCFHKTFPGCHVEAHSDLLAAARCLCGSEKGIAAILGTGANTCFYDGQKIVDNVPACGYILGDEGGGAVLGKKLVSDYLKRMLPEDLSEAFEKRYKLGLLDIIEKVYRQPMPNRFLASFTLFLGDHQSHPYVQEFLGKAFDEFFLRNIIHYDYKTYPVNIVGSVAFYFRNEVEASAARHGMRIGKIVRTPVEGLVTYHRNLFAEQK
ncbi:MAG: hypothetical protein BWX62_00922 [Bacteroidetes bacterium ADurb.Bin037]|nr:MAG: hypothetical protein BWX62_00922 [Bacteroidetes bacterium ADurb.Bin037]HPW78739.1 ATPase [Bacteroidales bacterium]HQB56242.1 ATPase [Bacteroidales bacterium]